MRVIGKEQNAHGQWVITWDTGKRLICEETDKTRGSIDQMDRAIQEMHAEMGRREPKRCERVYSVESPEVQEIRAGFYGIFMLIAFFYLTS